MGSCFSARIKAESPLYAGKVFVLFTVLLSYLKILDFLVSFS